MSAFPSTVQAITIAKTGGFEVLEKTAQPFPKVDPDHVVIKVQYAGVNFIDTYFRSGLYPLQEFPAIMGSETAGVVVGLPSDSATLSSEEYKKRGYEPGSKVAVYTRGTHAEYISVPWSTAIPLPASISTKVGAASLVQSLTAVSFMDEAYNVKKGDVVFVHTLAGGLGLLFTQYAKYKGATVIGTTSTPEKAELAKSNGADHVILYKDEDVAKRVLEITNGEGVDAVFDGVGKDTFEANFEFIKRKGTIVCVGNASGAVPPFSPLKLVAKNIKIVRPTMANYAFTPEEVSYYGKKIYGLIEEGVLKIRIFAEYPFTAEAVQQAQKDLTSGKTTGKLVVKVSE
ncbi:hypothetical protein PLICRDRAFT_35480 [Plicaturopsis crispa FD-325 SS-3]|nr:hypothetical protein PLICRDRAFT_35480 [Plicaturopsis crispa FD-325 SS-3]